MKIEDGLSKAFYTLDDVRDLLTEATGQPLPFNFEQRLSKAVREQQVTYSDIYRGILYEVLVNKHKIDLQYGVAFVVSNKYKVEVFFKQLELDRRRQKIEAKKVAEYQEHNTIFQVTLEKPKPRKIKTIDISQIEVEEEEDQ